ncbi:hypothetical protein A6A07_07900 [Streptomyces sp. CB03911]|nr:hypothetical protein [Streptomyces sp. CB03911]OKI19397.1 hypothetical protein A6A07_07900 [Streptomyces sp. CB03911]
MAVSGPGRASCAAVTATNSTGEETSAPATVMVTARPVTRTQARGVDPGSSGALTTRRTSSTSPAVRVAATAVCRLPVQAAATQTAPAAQRRSCRHQSAASSSSGSATGPHIHPGFAAPSSSTQAQRAYPTASRARSQGGPWCSRPRAWVISAAAAAMLSTVTRRTAAPTSARGKSPTSQEKGLSR